MTGIAADDQLVTGPLYRAVLMLTAPGLHEQCKDQGILVAFPPMTKPPRQTPSSPSVGGDAQLIAFREKLDDLARDLRANRMELQGIREKLNALDKNAIEVKGSINEVKNNLKWHKWAGGSVATACFSVIGLLFIYFILPLQNRVADNSVSLAKVETALHALASGSAAGRSQVILDTASKPSSPQLKMIANILQTAQIDNSSLDSVVSVADHLERIGSVDPSLSTDAWQAELALASYRTRMLEGTKGEQREADHPAVIAHDVIRGFAYGIKLPSNKLTPVADTLIETTNQVLDWGDWRDVTFENVHIVYHGSPVILTNVRFVHCTFEISRTTVGARMLQAIVREPYTTGRFVPVG